MRVIARICLVVVVFGILAGPAVYLGRHTIAPLAVSWLAHAGLGLNDLGGLDFRITGLSPTGLSLESITLADGRVTADTLEADFELAELFSGRLKSLTIAGMTVRTTYRDGGLDLGPFEPILTAGPKPENASPGPPRLPAEKVVLNAARLLVSSSWGELSAGLDAEATQAPDGALAWSGDLRARAVDDTEIGGVATIDMGVEGQLTTARDLSARLVLKRSDARFRDVSLESADGGVTLQHQIGGPLMARAAVRLGGLVVRGTTIPALSMDGFVQDGVGSLLATIGDASASAGVFTVAADMARGDGDRIKLSLSSHGALAVPHAIFGGLLGSPIRDVDGDLALRGEITLPGPLGDVVSAPATALLNAVGTGEAELSVSSVTLGERSHAVEVQVGLSAIAAPGLMEVRASETSHARLAKTLLARIKTLVPSVIHAWIEDGVSVSLGQKDRPVSLLVSYGQGVPSARLSGAVAGELGKDARIDLEGVAGFRAPMEEPTGSWALDLDDLSVKAGGLRIGGSVLRSAEVTFNGQAGSDGVSGSFTLDGAGTLDFAELAGDATIGLAGRLDGDGRETRLSFTRVGIGAERLGHAPSGISLLAPLSVFQTPSTVTEVAFSNLGNGKFPRAGRTDLDLGTVVLGLPGGSEVRAVKLTLGRIAAAFKDAEGDSPGSLTVDIDRLLLDQGTFPVRFSGLSAGAAFGRVNGDRKLTSFELAVAECAGTGRPVWITPFKIAFSGSQGAEPGELAYQGAVSSLSAPVAIPISGVLRPLEGSGRVEISRTVLDLGIEPPVLAALSPALASHVSTSKGKVGFSGRLTWPEIGIADVQGLAIEVEGLSLTSDGIVVENANGAVALAGVAPIRTDGTGSLSMDLLGVGVPISRPRAEFSVNGLSRIRLHHVSGELAGGKISASDASLSLDGPTNLTIHADGVDAADLSALVKVEGLAAEGRLSGTLPITWMPGIGLSIRNAELSADGPGTVRYKAGQRDEALRQSGEQVGLMLDALSDFRFTVLDMKLNGAPGAGFRIGLALEGANPNLYDGYPVRFNLDLAGQLDDIIKTGLRTYTLPDRVRDAVMRGEANE
jgi:hypothetical protein